MKKFFFLLAFTASYFSGFTQDYATGFQHSLKDRPIVDTCRLIVGYDFAFAVDTISDDRLHDNSRLEIGRKMSRYYSYLSFRIDSLFNVNTREINPHNELNLPRDRQPYHVEVYFNYPEFGTITTMTGFVNRDYVEQERIAHPAWNTLFVETKTILDYLCKRAETFFQGRLWTVWYTEQIPLQSGPWKLSGLPGLILEASDEQGLFRWQATEVCRGNDTPIYSHNKVYNKMVPATRKQVARLQMMQWKDFAGLIIAHGIAVSIMDTQTRKVRHLTGGDYPVRPYIPPLELE